MNPSLLIGRCWDNSFDYYDLIDFIEFKRDGTGMMGWGDGQAMKFELSFLYSMARGLLRLTWHDDFGARSRLLRFTITDGPFSIDDHNRMGPMESVVFQYKVEFDPHPLPSKRVDSKPIYYAEPVLKN